MSHVNQMDTIIGIDFGTTNSEVALYRRGAVQILADEQGRTVLPSAVYMDEQEGCLVGQAAKNVAVLHPQRTVQSVKRDLGSDKIYIIDGQSYDPQQIASIIFSYLRALAEKHTGETIERAVVTVPAYFDDLRRQAVMRAASLAGLEIVRIINEPTAAALAYGVSIAQEGTFVVYDFGGGTFDVSVMSAAEGVFQVLATRGDTQLGGDDFDRLIVNLLADRFLEETGIDLKADSLARQKLKNAAEAAKIELSDHGSTTVEVPFIAANQHGPCHLICEITRTEFEEMIRRYVERTLRMTRGALQDAGKRADQIDKILLVGGSSRIPAVRQAVQNLFARDVEQGIHPEEAVVCGAAVQAGVLMGDTQGVAFVDVTPLGLGVQTAEDRMITLIPRNSVLPVRSAAVFTTVADNQTSASIRVHQGERRRASENALLGSFKLEGIENGPQGKPDIRVQFDIDVNGVVSVAAEDRHTGAAQTVELGNAMQLTEWEIEDLVVEARAAELEEIFER